MSLTNPPSSVGGPLSAKPTTGNALGQSLKRSVQAAFDGERGRGPPSRNFFFNSPGTSENIFDVFLLVMSSEFLH